MRSIRPGDLVSVYRMVAGSDLHCRLLDLCDVLRPHDLRLIELVMGGATANEMSEQLSLTPVAVEGQIKRLRRDVHQ